jgi:hypothetical protein
MELDGWGRGRGEIDILIFENMAIRTLVHVHDQPCPPLSRYMFTAKTTRKNVYVCGPRRLYLLCARLPAPCHGSHLGTASDPYPRSG